MTNHKELSERLGEVYDTETSPDKTHLAHQETEGESG